MPGTTPVTTAQRGSPMIPMTWQLLKMLWVVDRDAMPRLRKLVELQSPQKWVVAIRTLAELRMFCRHLDGHAQTGQR
ncbi:MAG TPA: hypothetical protein VL069_02675, partial [Opitutus sp.]|nr:hypothetical protein [Opitutus sp.]